MMASPPMVYVETSFISYLAAKDSRDLFVLTRQLSSRSWWGSNRSLFRVYISEAVIREASRGSPVYAKDRLEILEGLEILDETDEVIGLAKELIRQKAVPEVATEDAAHIAFAAVYNMKYLLTWNFRHINNSVRKERLAVVCQTCGYVLPQICTPDELNGDMDNERSSN